VESHQTTVDPTVISSLKPHNFLINIWYFKIKLLYLNKYRYMKRLTIIIGTLLMTLFLCSCASTVKCDAYGYNEVTIEGDDKV